jgi:hypothetical protein
VSRLISASLFEGLVVWVDIPISEAIRIRLEAVFAMGVIRDIPNNDDERGRDDCQQTDYCDFHPCHASLISFEPSAVKTLIATFQPACSPIAMYQLNANASTSNPNNSTSQSRKVGNPSCHG